MSWLSAEGCGGCQQRKEKLIDAKNAAETFFKTVDKKLLLGAAVLVVSVVALIKK